jgi:RNA recognition motif-containing protein
MNIFIGNLCKQAMDNDLRTLFSAYGPVTVIRIMTDKFTRRSRGFAFIKMEKETDAIKAILALNTAKFMGQSLMLRSPTTKELQDSIF